MWGTPLNSEGARNDRLRVLAQGIADHKVFFSRDSHPEVFIQQAVPYSAHKANQRDDVVDSAAQLYELCLSLPLVPPAPKQILQADPYAGKPSWMSTEMWTQHLGSEREEHAEEQQRQEAEADRFNQESAAAEARRYTMGGD